ncbi:unnamed protein product, partial [Rotaria sp. Silwood2]
MDSQEEKRLCDCLNLIIQHVSAVLTQLKTKHDLDPKPPSSSTIADVKSTLKTTAITTDDDPLFANSVQNNNVNSFTIDIEEDELLNKLTKDVETILKGSLPRLSPLCSQYFEQFLHQYHFDKDQRVFTQELAANILYNFDQNLKGLLMAAKAYPAALKGDLAVVKKFLRQHPDYKDKSGFWGTTLL